MKSSPLGWPIAELDDARRDFPALVDEPRTMAIDAAVGAMVGAFAVTATGVALANAAAVKIPLTMVEAAGVTIAGTDITIVDAGWWEFHAAASFSAAPTGTQRFFLDVAAGARIWRQSPGISEGQTSTSGLQRFAVGDKITVSAYQASGAAATLASLYVAGRRIGT